jgi:hypothetical protein
MAVAPPGAETGKRAKVNNYFQSMGVVQDDGAVDRKRSGCAVAFGIP